MFFSTEQLSVSLLNETFNFFKKLTEWLNYNISLLELLIFTERKPFRWNGRVFFNRLENDPVDVDLSSGGISRAGVSRYLMSSLHQVLARQGARNNRSYNYHLYIGWYWVISLFFTQIKQTPPLNCKLLNLATELNWAILRLQQS